MNVPFMQKINALTLMIVLTLLAGCTTGVTVEPETGALSRPVADGSTVSRFENGRKGFVLTETANLNAASRHDFDRAVEAMSRGDFDQAIELFNRVLDVSPGITAPHINIAMAYRKNDKPTPAEEHLKTALELVPGHPVASNEYGLLLRQSGRFAEARDIYAKALTKFPEYYPARRNLGILCDLYLNDQKCALAQYELYSEARPDDEQVKLWISELRLRLGQ